MEGEVTRVWRDEKNLFHVSTEEKELQSKYLIIAIGVEDIMPEISGMDPYFEYSIFHCLTCDWYQHRKEQAVYVTDDDLGLESAIARFTMYQPEGGISVVPAGSNFFYSPLLVKKAKELGISIYFSPIKSLYGKDGYLNNVTLADGKIVPAKVIFTLLGHKRRDQFLDKGEIKLNRDEKGFIKVDFKTLESSIPNLFAVGPCNEGRDQAIVAAGQGATVAEEIHLRILKDLGL